MHLYNKFKPPFEIVSQKFLSKIKYGELSVTFPSGSMQLFTGINSAHKADLTINNYKFISKILKRKSNIFFNIYSKFKHFLNENTKSQSKKNIQYHYDLGNNFYTKWLDRSMTYSSAYFEKENQNLYDAQLNKYHKIAESLNLNENSKVLEIGCGWGGFSTYAA